MTGSFLINSVYLRCRKSINSDATILHYNASQLNNDLFELSVEHFNGNVKLTATIKQELIIELFYVQLRLQKQGPIKCLNRFYQLVEINKEIDVNDFTPLYLLYQDRHRYYLLNNARNIFNYSAKDEGDHLNFVLYIDAAAMHPAWSHRETERKSDAVRSIAANHRYNLSFSVTEIGAQSLPPVLCRYPYGAEASFIITDHCDYDQVDTFHSLLHGNKGKGGWLGNGLKMTKGVFALRSNYKKHYPAATLEDENYKKLVAELYADGSEIVPHALNQSGQISKIVFDTALDTISKEYNCRTWIDHGSYQKYTYSVGGGENEYCLLDRLKQWNYFSLWSYYDAPIDANQTLNIFNSTRPNLRTLGENIFRGKWMAAAHYLKSILEQKAQLSGRKTTFIKLMSAVRKNTVSSKSLTGLLKDISNIFKYSSAQKLPYTAEELGRFAPLLYTETRQPFYQQKADMLLFASQEVVHTQDVYTPDALQKLIEEKGLHIGHTYLLNTLGYLNGVFDTKSKQLSSNWISFIKELSNEVKNGRIWNPTMGEFTHYMLQLQQLKITYNANRNTMILKNCSNTHMRGISFIINDDTHSNLLWNGVKPMFKEHEGGLIFWGDLSPQATIHISW